MRLSETPSGEPREQGALPSSPGLCHAVYGLDNAADTSFAIRTGRFVSGGRVAIDNLTGLELSL
eukprot:6203928-Pleurochrysis_carterae.AAC.3